MDLESARRYIQTCLERMRAAYLKPVFDEWAILSLPAKTAGEAKPKGGILAYVGPRPEAFRTKLADDAELLRAHTSGRPMTEGDLEFVADAAGTRYDALVKIGPTSFLVLNHTARTLQEIRGDAKWLGAQRVLFELTEKFRGDPLV